MIVSSLKSAGVHAVSGPALLTSRGAKTDSAKARIVQSEVDAVLYVSVLEKGTVEELIPSATHDGQTVTFAQSYDAGFIALSGSLSIEVTDANAGLFILKDDGTVYQPLLILKLSADLQDTQSAKQVWRSETISSGKPNVTTMHQLFVQASAQTTEKMRADGAI